jgi:hypothetical protein
MGQIGHCLWHLSASAWQASRSVMKLGAPVVPWSTLLHSRAASSDRRLRSWVAWRDAEVSEVDLAFTSHRLRPWVARIKNHRGNVESRRFSDERDACNWLLARRGVVALHEPPPPPDPPDMEWRNWL